MPDSSLTIKPFGLSEVYVSPQQPPLVDIVFVHGLNGHSKETWTSKSGVFWPVDLLPKIIASKQVRILIYGYNANVVSFTGGTSTDRLHHHAEKLAADLVANRSLRECLDRPIVFVCHSLGGLIVKRALIYCRNVVNEKIEHLRSVYVSTYGILFLGTPHNGSDFAKWGSLLQNICSAVLPKRFLDSSPQLVETLKTDSETLQNVNRLFIEIMGRFHIYFFHETKPMDIGTSRIMIVDSASAAPDFEGVERMGIEANHSDICKFEDETAQGYEAVAEAILRYSRDAPATITWRWMEERKRRQVELAAKAIEIYGVPVEVPNRQIGDSILQERSGTSSPTSLMGKSVDLGNSLLIQQPLFVVPPGFHPNDSFFGMQKELTELHTRLFKAKRRTERVMAVVICGGPGSGKTHLARQYVHLYRGDYTGGIFWVDAKSRYSASMCFWDIAQAATLTDENKFKEPRTDNPGRHVDAVRKWLETRENWLLIFDGISFHGDEDIDFFRHFLPFSKNSSIIYTSVDQTLRRKTRLFEPYCLTVQNLAVPDALALLFKDLGIRKPTQEQRNKAIEVVEYYDCLPLAIHAISHRLSATSQPIEKYHIHSHLTDMKLAEPFRNIMDDLLNRNYIAALNLVNLLSFFSHHVPVGLILLGRPALVADNVEIFSNSQSGDRGDIDTTLGILIRYGLIDRVSDPYVTSLRAKESLEQEDQSATSSFELSEPPTDSTRIAPSAVYQSFVDTIKIHSVVQSFCRDELKIQDQNDGFGESSSKGSSGHGRGDIANQGPGRYYSWLTVAARILVKSYETAIGKSKSSGDPPLIKDYGEYETQAEKLLEHFPKKIPPYPSIVPDAHDKLKQVLKSIKGELDKISPGSSEECLRREKSIFDRSSSSSSAPDSSTEGALSRRSTWNPDGLVTVQVESPVEAVPPPNKLDLFPLHIYKETHNEKDHGYESDSESLKRSHRVSPTPSEMSQATEIPKITQLSERYQGKENWQLVKRPLKTRASSVDRRRRFRNRLPRNLGEYRPSPTLTKLSSAQGRGSLSSVANVSGGANAKKNTDARTLLAAVHQSSPPPSRGGIIKAIIGRGRSQDRSQQTYASIVANGQQSPVPIPVSSPPPERGSPGLKRNLMVRNSQDSLTSLSSDAPPSSMESRPNQFLTLARSDPGLAPEPHLRPSEINSEPGSQLQSRHPSMSRANITTDLPYPFSDNKLPPLPFDEDISLTRIRHQSPFRSTRTLGPNAHPSAIMPGASPPQSIPGGYMSEPMSYDTSRQSHESWQTESHHPSNYSQSPGLSPARPLYNYSQLVVPPEEAIYETGSWIPNLQENRTPESDPSYITRGRSNPGTSTKLFAAPENNGRPTTMLFGQHEVDVYAARQRARENERERKPSPRPIPKIDFSVPTPKLEITRQQENIPSRLRSKSSPSRPDLTGLGLEYN